MTINYLYLSWIWLVILIKMSTSIYSLIHAIVTGLPQCQSWFGLLQDLVTLIQGSQKTWSAGLT